MYTYIIYMYMYISIIYLVDLILYGMIIFNGPCIESKAAGLKDTIVIKRIQVHPCQRSILQDKKEKENSNHFKFKFYFFALSSRLFLLVYYEAEFGAPRHFKYRHIELKELVPLRFLRGRSF